MIATEAFAPLIRKLRRLTDLAEADCHAIRSLPFSIMSYAPRGYIVREDEAVGYCRGLVDGFACRHKVVADGGRQIVAIHIPGDFVDLQHLYLNTADHNVVSLTPTTLVCIAVAPLRELVRQRPNIARALWRDTLIDASISREWIANIGRRSACERVAHLLCELIARCEAAGLVSPDGLKFPLTQQEIADATGLTPVYVNRMLRCLRDADLIVQRHGSFRILDWQRVRDFAGFNTRYLHQGV